MASFISKLLLVAALQAHQSGGQRADPSQGDISRVVGRVMRPGAASMLAVPNTWVTLHRVGTDHAGPLDSIRTSSTGAYAFTYRRSGDPSAMYFASSSYGGIAYISKPFQPGVTNGDDAEIDVFDTTSHIVPMSVRGRHLIVSAPVARGARVVTEVFDLSNDSSVTRLAADDTPRGAVWSSTLPPQASNLRVNGGDIPAEAVKFVGGRAYVYAPFAPGMKQLVYSYTLPESAFPFSLPLERPTSVFEVLLEEPQAVVHGVAMRVAELATIEGRQFHRYLASDVPANGIVTIRVPEVERPVNVWYVATLTIVIGALMTVALARAVRRR